jgi:hypothetical protein
MWNESIEYGSVESEWWSPDDRFLHRIKNAYKFATDCYQQPPQTVWAEIDGRRNDIHTALLSNDDASARELLSRPDLTNLYVGTDIICKDFTAAFAHHPDFALQRARWTHEHLVHAAESMGAIPLPYPEATERPPTIYSTDEVLDRIDKMLGTALQYPNPFPLEFGLKSSRGVISWKVPMAIYQAHRLKALGRLVGGAKILEIGAGVGRTALHARQLGFTDYATIDLPLGIIAQACFLGAVLGPDAIWMAGDDTDPRPGQIRLLPSNYLDDRPEDFDIILNVDSLTEMSRAQADAYFAYFLKHGKMFYSINHEINPFRVSEMHEGFLGTVLRHPCAIRAGYAEEYFFQPRPAV